MTVKVDVDAYIGYGAYAGACPVGVLNMNDGGKSVYDEGTCIDCGSRVSVYPVSTISQ